MYIERALEPVVRRYSEHFKVVVVAGPRQVGKTTMLKHLAEQDERRGVERSYATLDNTALRLAAKEDPELFLQRYRPPVLIDEKTAKSWLSLLESTYLVKVVRPYSNNLLKRLNKQPVMHFTDTGLAAYLSGWYSARSLELGAMGGQIFETYAFEEVYKSYANMGLRPPLTFFRNNDKKEIDLLLDMDGRLHPVEVKSTAAPGKGDLKNFSAIDPVASDDVPADLSSLKREIGLGAVVCMASDAYPLSRRAWCFPVWAI